MAIYRHPSAVDAAIHNIIHYIQALNINSIILAFYSLLWFINPSNKLTLLFSIIFCLCIYVNRKNLRETLPLCYIILSLIGAGKRYDFIIIPPGVFPIDYYPLGYYVSATITPATIIACIVLLVLLRDWVAKRLVHTHIIFPDLLLLFGALFRLTTIVYASPIKDIAMILWLFSLPTLILYFYIRFVRIPNRTFLQLVFSIFTTLVIIESSIGMAQFIHASPFGKSIEASKGVELFGEAADEYSYRFRPIGTFSHANSLGAFLAIYIPIILYTLQITNTLSVVALFTGLIALGLTLSRSAWTGICAGLSWQLSTLIQLLHIFFQKLHFVSKFIIVFMICTFTIGILTPRVITSIYSFADTGGAVTRSIQISLAAELIRQSPWFGVGTAMYVPKALEIDTTGLIQYFPSPVHNRYYLQTAEDGILSLLLSVALYISTIMLIYIRTKDKSAHTKNLFFLYSGVICTVILIGLFQPYNFDGQIILLFSLIYTYVS